MSLLVVWRLMGRGTGVIRLLNSLVFIGLLCELKKKI
jgi:hypothetical protein